MYSDDFLIFRITSVTRQFLVPLTSIVFFFLLWKSVRPETVWLLIFFKMNGFENGKTQLFNSGGVVK